MLETQKKSVKAGKRVDTNHVSEAIQNYKRERWIQNSKRLGKEDSLSVWYSLAEIEEFLATSKAHGGDGIRFYFGAYDKDKAHRPGYEGRQTIILVATKEKETLQGTANKDIYVQTEKGSSILAYNFGHVCPPYCGHDVSTLGVTIVSEGEEGMRVL